MNIKRFGLIGLASAGLVLGVAGPAGAWSNALVPTATAATHCVDSGGTPVLFKLTPSGSDSGSGQAVYSSTPTASTTPPPGTVSANKGNPTKVAFSFPQADAGQSVTVTATVVWDGDKKNHYSYSASVVLPAACPPSTTTTTTTVAVMPPVSPPSTGSPSAFTPSTPAVQSVSPQPQALAFTGSYASTEAAFGFMLVAVGFGFLVYANSRRYRG